MPIDGFKPEYFPLADGSLICPPLIRDLLQVHAIIIICSALFVFFLRNTFTVVRYIRSGEVPHKTLLYTLLGSQVTGLVFPLPTLISTFTKDANCRTYVMTPPQTRRRLNSPAPRTEVVSTMTNFLSLSLLVTGILGVKAYRCLDNSKAVLVGLVLLRSATVVLITLDAINLDAGRRLAGKWT